MNSTESYRNATGAELRAAIRAGRFNEPTAGQALGYAQANVVILPEADAAEFAEFCRLNAQACPLLCQTAPGNPEPTSVAVGADLRTDVPRYRIFAHGVRRQDEPHEVLDLWRDDFVGFLLGCSFTFETALLAAGLGVRHIEQGVNVPMFRTTLPCETAGRFAGPLVVSMRPYRPERVEQVVAVTSRYPTMHGAPVQIGEPERLGIEDINRPDFGNAVTLLPGEIPVFWACGVTPQLALAAARPALAITHSPGYMFVTDLRDTDFEQPG
jgi:uncharacterized protein YcsI (UPF0317 family)